MITIKHIFTIALLICAFAMPSLAMTIGELNKDCQEKDIIGQAFCLGIIHGIAAQRNSNCGVARSMHEHADSDRAKFLVAVMVEVTANETKGSKIEALKKAFTNWADAHPEKWELSANVELSVKANNAPHFLDAWPCELDKN